MNWHIHEGDCRDVLRSLPAQSVHTCVTSPPYFGLRDYGADRQIGLEPTPDEFVAALVEVFREVRRVLRDDGTVWLNLGDSYGSGGQGGGIGSSTLGPPGQQGGAWHERTFDPRRYEGQRSTGCKPKDLLGIPWMVAFALRADGWYLRSDIIWSKPNPMPESVTDRPTKSHEYVFLLSKSAKYHYDADAIREPHDRIKKYGFAADGLLPHEREGRADERPRDSALIADGTMHGGGGFRSALNPAGRNKRSVWTVATQPYAGAHFATFPPKLIEPCVLAGAPERACGECGAPWVRVVEIESRPNWQGNGSQKHDGTYYRENIGGGVGNDRRERRDLGFEPSCSHGDGNALLAGLDMDMTRTQARRAVELARQAGLTRAHIDAIRACGVGDAGKAQVTQDGYGKNDPAVQALADEAKTALGGYHREFLLARRTPGAPQASCNHDANTKPGVVLDPFAGAGTTGLVALQHGREFVGIELNPEYAQMARDRIETAVRLGFRPPQNGAKVSDDQLDIFGASDPKVEA